MLISTSRRARGSPCLAVSLCDDSGQALTFRIVMGAPPPVSKTPGTEHEVTATGTIIYGMRGLTVAPGSELAAIAVPHD